MISENKLKHSLGVARKCAKIAEEKGFPEDAVKASFVMGLLHDIGYEAGDVAKGHSGRSGDYVEAFLKHQKDCIDAIRSHGKPGPGLSVMNDILNSADLTTNFEGMSVSIEERLQDIRHHYGEYSDEYINSLIVAKNLDLLPSEKKDSSKETKDSSACLWKLIEEKLRGLAKEYPLVLIASDEKDIVKSVWIVKRLTPTLW